MLFSKVANSIVIVKMRKLSVVLPVRQYYRSRQQICPAIPLRLDLHSCRMINAVNIGLVAKAIHSPPRKTLKHRVTQMPMNTIQVKKSLFNFSFSIVLSILYQPAYLLMTSKNACKRLL